MATLAPALEKGQAMPTPDRLHGLPGAPRSTVVSRSHVAPEVRLEEDFTAT